jgi:hypothetical protein
LSQCRLVCFPMRRQLGRRWPALSWVAGPLPKDESNAFGVVPGSCSVCIHHRRLIGFRYNVPESS